MSPTLLLAIGGNALLRPGEQPTVGVERAHVVDTCRAIADIACTGWRIVITHGNGPQDEMTVADLRALAERQVFHPGSMGPKVEAALRFVDDVGHDAVVCSLDQLAEGVAGQAGTRIAARCHPQSTATVSHDG